MKKEKIKKAFLIVIVFMLVISVFAGALNNVSAQGDSFSDAEEITPGEYSGELIDEENEQDFYKIHLDSSSIITINFTAEEPADLRLRLWQPDRSTKALELESKNGATDSGDYYLAYETDPDYWYIEVYEYFGTFGNYTFEVEVESQNDAGSGQDAPDTFTDAFEVGEGDHNGTIRDLDEVDMYKVDLEGDQIINIDFTPEEPADLRLEFYDPDRNSLFTLESSSGATESGDYAVSNGTEPDYWYIEVYEYFGTYGDYTFDVQLTEQDDAGSGGDAAGAGPDTSLPEHPTPISTGSYTGYMNEPGDVRDIYGMDLSSGNTMTVTVNPPSSIVIDTGLFNDEHDELVSDVGNSPGEESEVTYTATSEEFIYIWLKCQGGDGTYDIDIDVTGAEGPDKVTVDDPTDITSSSMKLSWSQSQIDNFERYEVYASTSSGSLGNEVDIISSKTTTSTTIDGLSSDTTYYFTVRVVNDIGESKDSDQVSAKTLEDGQGYTGTIIVDGPGEVIAEVYDEEENRWVESSDSPVEDQLTGQAPSGTQFKLTAVPDEGSEFEEWTGDETGTDTTIEFTMDEDKTITANFQSEENGNGGTGGNASDYPDFIQDYIERGMWCFALLLIIPILIIIVIIVVLVKLLKGGDEGGKQQPQQQRQQPPQQQREQPPQDQGRSGQNPPPPPEED